MRLSEANLPQVDEEVKPSDYIIDQPITVCDYEEGARKDGSGFWQIWTVRDRGERDMYRVWGTGKNPMMKIKKFFQAFPNQELDVILVKQEFGDEGKFRYLLEDWPAEYYKVEKEGEAEPNLPF